MKKLILLIGFLLTMIYASANDSDRISLGVYVLNNPQTIPSEVASLLETRMKKLVVTDGFADDDANGRFALIAKCDILEKDIALTTPPRISQKLEISFLVVDILENKIYGSYETTVSGIGTNETKAFNTAFQKVSSNNTPIHEMLEKAKERILDYYNLSCSQIIAQAKTWASTGKFDEAIFSLMSVPPVCEDCYNKCLNLAAELYQNKIDTECTTVLEQAKNIWATSKNGKSADEIATIISQINPMAQNYTEVIAFRTEVSDKLDVDAKRDWDFKIKQYEDNRELNKSIVDVCRSIGELYAKNYKTTNQLIIF